MNNGSKGVAAIVTVPCSPTYGAASSYSLAGSPGENESIGNASELALSLEPEAHDQQQAGANHTDAAACHENALQQTAALPARKEVAQTTDIAKTSEGGQISNNNVGGWGRPALTASLIPCPVDMSASAHFSEPSVSSASNHRAFPGRKVGQGSMASSVGLLEPHPAANRNLLPAPAKPLTPSSSKQPSPQRVQVLTSQEPYGGLSRSAATALSATADLQAAAMPDAAPHNTQNMTRGLSYGTSMAARREYTVGVAANAQSRQSATAQSRPRSAPAPKSPSSSSRVKVPLVPLAGATISDGNSDMPGAAPTSTSRKTRPRTANANARASRKDSVAVVREGRALAPGPRSTVHAGPDAMPYVYRLRRCLREDIDATQTFLSFGGVLYSNFVFIFFSRVSFLLHNSSIGI